MKRYAILPGLLLLASASGCLNEIRDDMAECKFRWSTYWAADQAWSNMASTCVGMNCPNSFKDGFWSGYKNVASGGTGCVPAVPELSCCNHMWLDHCSDSDKMAAWYDGFELGVIAARNDGMADANRLQSRLPQSTPVDYSSLNQPQPNGSSRGNSINKPGDAPQLNIPQQNAPYDDQPQPVPDASTDPQTYYLPNQYQR